MGFSDVTTWGHNNPEICRTWTATWNPNCQLKQGANSANMDFKNGNQGVKLLQTNAVSWLCSGDVNKSKRIFAKNCKSSTVLISLLFRYLCDPGGHMAPRPKHGLSPQVLSLLRWNPPHSIGVAKNKADFAIPFRDRKVLGVLRLSVVSWNCSWSIFFPGSSSGSEDGGRRTRNEQRSGENLGIVVGEHSSCQLPLGENLAAQWHLPWPAQAWELKAGKKENQDWESATICQLIGGWGVQHPDETTRKTCGRKHTFKRTIVLSYVIMVSQPQQL
jgi:hypothetical protein